MPSIRSIFLTIAITSLFGTSGAGASACDEWPDKIYVLRHAEKADPSDADSPLSDRGWCMAAKLGDALANDNVTAIFVTKKRRTQQTAENLAERKGLTPTVIPKTDHDDLMTAICKAGNAEHVESVVVVGHESTVPKVLDALERENKRPAYGDLFIVVPSVPGVDEARYGDRCD